MSMGSDWNPGDEPTRLNDPALERVWGVLNRDVPLGSLTELRIGMDTAGRPPLNSDTRFALGFDTNASFRVGLGVSGADALDYLRAKHRGPVIIPGQTVQEVWNNLLSAVEPQARKLRRRFDDLSTEVRDIDISLGASGVAVRDAIDDLLISHGDWIDPLSQAAFVATLDVFEAVGTWPYVPRLQFAGLGEIRKSTKTPPGFLDPVGYGDFFVWADFLFGLAAADPATYEAVVFVTNDVKADWSRNGVAHPVLASGFHAGG